MEEVIGDLNHDGTNEVIIGASKEYGGYRGGLYALNNQGKRLAGFPVLVDESFTAAPALADFALSVSAATTAATMEATRVNIRMALGQ